MAHSPLGRNAMSCFGELFARYPDKVMDLCMDEAWDAKRPHCAIDPTELPDVNPCGLCDAHCFDRGEPWGYAWDTCESPDCVTLWGWYHETTKNGGGRRRMAFKRLHGKTIHQVPRGMRHEAILAAMLLVESQEKANGGKQRLRVAA